MGNIVEARVKTSASIRPSIWNLVQRAALERRTSASDILEDALKEWLSRNYTGNLDENTIQSKPLEARHEKLLVEMRDLLGGSDRKAVEALYDLAKFILSRKT